MTTPVSLNVIQLLLVEVIQKVNSSIESSQSAGKIQDEVVVVYILESTKIDCQNVDPLVIDEGPGH